MTKAFELQDGYKQWRNYNFWAPDKHSLWAL